MVEKGVVVMLRLSKRIKFCILATLVVLSTSVFLFSKKVYALSILEEAKSFSMNVLTGKDQIKISSQIVEEKSKKLEVLELELNNIETKKDSIETTVINLKDQVAALDDMFVKIDKYAPDSAGNTYSWGYCTYYVKNRRPDMSNSWGNANTWYYRAKYQGWNVGNKAKKGAIATTTAGWAGHVAYVEKVSLDGNWVTVSEMNYGGFNRISSRTVHFSEFLYIYELN